MSVRSLRSVRPVRAMVIGLIAGSAIVTWTGSERYADALVQVRYEVTSPVPAAMARVTYQTSCGDTITTAHTPLPWMAMLSLRPGALASVSAELKGEGEITVRLLVNGDRLTTKSARGNLPVAGVIDVP